jgi:hypothetical protein
MSIIWHNDKGDKISCVEKIKVMEQNLAEIKLLLQDVIDDGVLMGISEQQIKEEIIKLIELSQTAYKKH